MTVLNITKKYTKSSSKNTKSVDNYCMGTLQEGQAAMKPISFKKAKKQGVTAPSTKVSSKYSYSTLKKRDIMDSVIDGFDSNLAARVLGELTGGKDPFCGEQILEVDSDGEWSLIDEANTQWDHLIPVGFLGLTTDGNICPICKKCNQAKSDRNPFEFQSSLRTKGEAYLTGNGFRKFHKAFSAIYKENFDSLYDIAFSLATNNAEEYEIRSHIDSFFEHTVIRNGKRVRTIQISSNERFWETSPSRSIFEPLRNAETLEGKRTTLNNIQRIVDNGFFSDEFDSADPTQSVEVFLKVAERAYELASVNSELKEEATVKTDVGRVKTMLTVIAVNSRKMEIIEQAAKLPTYKNFITRGFTLVGMNAEDTESLEKLAELATNKNVASRLSRRGALHSLIAEHMMTVGIKSFNDFSLNDLKTVENSYIKGDETSSIASQKRQAITLCAMKLLENQSSSSQS